LEAVVSNLEQLGNGLQDIEELLTLAAEENDETTIAAVLRDLEQYERQVAALEFQRMFCGEMDPCNAFLDIQPVPAAPRPRTGRRCCCGCICAGGSGVASRPI